MNSKSKSQRKTSNRGSMTILEGMLSSSSIFVVASMIIVIVEDTVMVEGWFGSLNMETDAVRSVGLGRSSPVWTQFWYGRSYGSKTVHSTYLQNFCIKVAAPILRKGTLVAKSHSELFSHSTSLRKYSFLYESFAHELFLLL